MPVLTDVQWSAIEPLIEAVRPQTGRELTNLRRTFEAIVWRMQNGAKWRAIPAELGPWWMAAQTFIRWSKLGVWERFFEAAKAAGRPALGMVFMDSTIIRAHQKAAGAVKRGTMQPRHRARMTKRLAAARAVSAQRLTLLPTRVAALWALL
jgi:transposase